MVGSKLRALLVLVILSLAVAAPAQAFFFDPGIPLIRTDLFTGNAAISYRVNVPVDGTELWVGIEGFGTGVGNAGFGAWSSGFAFAATSYGGKTYTHVEGPVIGEVIDERSGGFTGGPFGVAMGLAGLDAGEYTFTVVGVTDGTGTYGDANVWATNGATVTNATFGDGFLYREPDFAGGVNTVVSRPGTATAKAVVSSSVTESISGNLFGIFQATLFDPISAISYDDPSGGHHVGSPPFPLFFYLGEGPGTYKFNIDLNAGAGPFPGIFVWGGDVVPA